MSKELRSGLIVLGVGLIAGCGIIDGLSGGPRDGETDETPDGGSPEVPHAGDWRWHGPVRVENAGIPKSDAPRLAVRPGGRAYVAFHVFDQGTNTGAIWLATRAPRGGAFGNAVKVLPVPGHPIAAYPQVAVGAKGAAVLAFGASDDARPSPDRHVYAARFGDDLAVAPSAIVRLDASGSQTPQMSLARALAVDEEGRAVFAWGEDGGAYVSASAGGGTWTPAELLGPAGSVQWSALAVAASQGRSLAAVTNNTGIFAQVADISAGRYAGGEVKQVASWENNLPAVAMRGPHAIVAWRSGATLLTQSYTDGWGAGSGFVAARIAGNGLAVATNSVGKAVVVYRREPEGSTDFYEAEVWAATFDGAAWSTPQRISYAGAHRKCWWLDVAIDDHGDAVAAWADFDEGGTFTRIWANVLHANGGAPAWTGPVAIDQATPDAGLHDKPENRRYVDVGLDPRGGGATVVWMQHEPDGTPRVWANWLE